MKRFHVHVGVADLERSIRFHSGLFGVPPTLRKDDYAKWMAGCCAPAKTQTAAKTTARCCG